MFLTRARLSFGTSLFLAVVALEGCSLNPQVGKPDDSAIVSSIGARLFQDTVLKRQDIRVESQGGVVTLQGSVNTVREKAAVERIARGASGCQQGGRSAGGNESQGGAPKRAHSVSASGSRRRPRIRAYIQTGTARPALA